MTAEPKQEQATVHLRVFGNTRPVSFPVRLGDAPLDDLVAMARAVAREAHVAAVEQVEGQGETLSCAKGCSACCYQLVPISPLEARRLAQAVDAMPAAQRDQVRERFEAACRRLDAIGIRELPSDPKAWREADERYRAAHIACPLLADDVCSVYSERPIICAAYAVTTPAERCASRRGPVTPVPQPLGGSGVLTATVSALTGKRYGPIPIARALAWHAAHGAELEVERDGETMFWALSKQLDAAADKDFHER